MRTLSSVLAVLALSSLAACGGSDDLSATAALNGLISTQCDKAFECKATYTPPASDPMATFEGDFGATVAACEMKFAIDKMDLTELEASISAGRVKYNAADAQKCVDGFAAMTCGQFWGTEMFTPPAACETAIVGTVADGGACTIPDDCVGATSDCDPTTKKCTPQATPRVPTAARLAAAAVAASRR